MDIHGYSAHVLVNGRKVKEYRHNGNTFIEAKDGTEFAIEVKNHQGGRVLAIVSVDGLDVIDGKPATDKSRGYIVGGHNADTFHGWRKSDTEVGAFKFVTSDKSYATEKGEGQNNGVIAVKLIAEKIAPITHWQNSWKGHRPKQPDPFYPKLPTFPTFPRAPRPYWEDTIYSGQDNTGGLLRSCGGGTSTSASINYCATAQGIQNQGEYVMSASAAEAPAFDMGTTWGSKREDKVVTTTFEYGEEIATLEFFYASREALKAMGIQLVNLRAVGMPQAFASSNYAQPPKNWK